jgi:mannose-6-phosphate isomerase-like protein (cupin superfamily)
LVEIEGKGKGTMSSREDQAQKETLLNGAEEDAASRIFAHEPGEGEAWWWFGGLATIKATREQTGGRYSLVEILVPEFPKEEGLLHVHHFEDEGFYVLEGEMTFYIGDQTKKARPGSFLFGPKDVPHAFTVESGPARLLFILSPAGMEGLIREMGEPARSLTVPPQPEEPPNEAEMERRSLARHRGSRNASPPPVRAGV